MARVRRESRSSRDVAVDDLTQPKVAVVRREVKGLRLDASRIHGHPFYIVLCNFRVRDGVCLPGDGLDGVGAIDGLLSAGDICQPAAVQRTVCARRWVALTVA